MGTRALRIAIVMWIATVVGCAEQSTPGEVDATAWPEPESGPVLPSTVDPAQCAVSCEAVPTGGACIEDVLVRCVAGKVSCVACDLEGSICSFVQVTSQAECKFNGFVNPSCVPDCDEQRCGDDGCGGSCGFCPENAVCDGQTCWLAGAACGDIGAAGGCLGESLANCVDDGLYYLDCGAIGLICGLNEQSNKYECLFE